MGHRWEKSGRDRACMEYEGDVSALEFLKGGGEGRKDVVWGNVPYW